MAKKGDRVVAISHSKNNKVYIYGTGTYLGDMKPTLFSEANQPTGTLGKHLITNDTNNPCIELDSGGMIWGCECWWCNEKSERLIKFMEDKEVIKLNIQTTRKESKKDE